MVSSPDVRVDGMDGGAIYAALTGGAGPSGLTDNSSGWCTRSSGYTEVQAAIEAALNRAGATWQGRGADSAQSAVSPLGDWAAQTSAASMTASDAVNSQVDAFSTARNSVQPMAAVPSKPFWNNFVPWNTDYDSAVSHNNEVTAHNRTVLASYGSATDTHVATLPPFEPPAAVGTDFVNSPSPSPSASDAGHLGSSWDGGGSGATGAAGGGTGGGGATGADGGTTSSGSSSSGGGGGYSGGAGSSGGADSPGVPSRVGEPGQNSGGAAVSAGGGQYASGTGSPGGGVGTSGPPGSGRPEQGSPLSTPGPVGQNSDDYASGVHSAAFNPDPPGAGTYGGASAASPGGYGSAGNGYGAGSSGAGGGSGAGGYIPGTVGYGGAGATGGGKIGGATGGGATSSGGLGLDGAGWPVRDRWCWNRRTRRRPRWRCWGSWRRKCARSRDGRYGRYGRRRPGQVGGRGALHPGVPQDRGRLRQHPDGLAAGDRRRSTPGMTAHGVKAERGTACCAPR